MSCKLFVRCLLAALLLAAGTSGRLLDAGTRECGHPAACFAESLVPQRCDGSYNDGSVCATKLESCAISLLTADGSSHRKLAGFPACPAGCKEDGVSCVQDGTAGGLRCIACQGTLTVTNAGQCGEQLRRQQAAWPASLVR